MIPLDSSVCLPAIHLPPSSSPPTSTVSIKSHFPLIGMEDSHSIHLFLPPTSVSRPPEEAKAPADEIQEQPAGSTVTNNSLGIDGPAFFGVFDGHGGSTVAKFAGTTLHSRLADLPAYSLSLFDLAETLVGLMVGQMTANTRRH